MILSKAKIIITKFNYVLLFFVGLICVLELGNRDHLLIPVSKVPKYLPLKMNLSEISNKFRHTNYLTEKRSKSYENKEEFMERMKKKMKDRKQLMKKKCKEFGSKSWSQNQLRFVTAHAHKFLYCCVPKAGVTNWKKLGLRLNGVKGNFSEISRFKIHHELSAPFTEDSFRLPEGTENYLKVMVVRNPFSRLVSAYNDKLVRKRDGVVSFGRTSRLIRFFFNHDKHKNGLATFQDFANYMIEQNPDVLTKVESNIEQDRHWMTYYNLCDPCRIDYDVIGHLESIQEDSRYILELLNVSQSIRFDQGYSSSGSSQTTKQTVSRMLETLDPLVMQKLTEKFRLDSEIFGYPLP